VDNLNLEIGDGELVVLVGPSGCGKTTTLRLIAGLERVTSGSVWIGSRPNGLREVTHVPAQLRNVGWVPESAALYPHWTVRQNLAFPLRMRGGYGWRWAGWPCGSRGKRIARMADRRVQRMADRLGLTPLLDRPVEQLSAGERGRVALGRALVRRPAVCLLDEPLANLDPPQRRALASDLKRWQRQLGVSMLCVTHDPAEALALADRVAVLEQGRLEQFATPQDIYERPATRWVAEMLGRPAMNLIAGRVTAEGFELANNRGGTRAAVLPASQFAALPSSKTQVLLGVRATEVAISPAAANAAAHTNTENSTCPPGVLTLEGQVQSLELAEGRRWATVEVCGQSVVGLASDGLAAGQRATVRIETTRCVWFDVGTGRKLGP
jgi:ABC-type sugar transport system ATPase subunit